MLNDSVISISNSRHIHISNLIITGSLTGITIFNSSNIWLDALEVVKFGKSGIVVKDSVDVRITRSVVSENGEHGIQLESVERIQIRSSKMENNGRTGLTCQNKCINLTVQCNVFKQSEWEGIWIIGGLDQVPTNILISNSLFLDQTTRDILLDQVQNVSIYRNTFISSKFHTSTTIVTSKACNITNNVGNTDLEPDLHDSTDILVEHNTESNTVRLTCQVESSGSKLKIWIGMGLVMVILMC